jgi:hypothetical protein
MCLCYLGCVDGFPQQGQLRVQKIAEWFQVVCRMLASHHQYLIRLNKLEEVYLD